MSAGICPSWTLFGNARRFVRLGSGTDPARSSPDASRSPSQARRPWLGQRPLSPEPRDAEAREPLAQSPGSDGHHSPTPPRRGQAAPARAGRAPVRGRVRGSREVPVRSATERRAIAAGIQTRLPHRIRLSQSGGGEIRTHGAREGSTVFETVTLRLVLWPAAERPPAVAAVERSASARPFIVAVPERQRQS